MMRDAILLETYLDVKRFVSSRGFDLEIAWQEERKLSRVTEPMFLREACWTVLSSGMRERVVSNLFPRLSECFLGWSSSAEILKHARQCESEALSIWRHEKKIRGILDICRSVAELGVEAFVDGLKREGPSFLAYLPFIGPVTSFHLAKNLGYPCAKPDRHLVRIAAASGYADVQAFCATLGALAHESIAVVDVVLWRFATLVHEYEVVFSPSHNGETPRWLS